LIKFIRIPNSQNCPTWIKFPWHRWFNLTITLLFFLSLAGHAQITLKDSLNKISAAGHIDGLKSGHLVIILPDYEEKIRHLTQWSEDSSLSHGRRNRIIKSLDNTIAERDSFSTRFIDAMRKSYRFSDWGYIWKSELTKTSDEKSLAIQKELEYDSKELVQLGSYTYFLIRGETDNGAEALIVCNRYLEPLEKPFPYFMRINSFTGIIDSLFGPSKFSWKDFDEMVLEWNSRLIKFWEKSAH
jgi:hypothetical protein